MAGAGPGTDRRPRVVAQQSCADTGPLPRAWAQLPVVNAGRRLCAGFYQCGSFVEVFVVNCVLSFGGWVVLVLVCITCRTVSGVL